jgi:cytochrome c oxidase subunit 4
VATEDRPLEAVEAHGELASHPGPAQYVKVAIVLAVATGLEVGLYYIKGLPTGLLVFLLLFFAVIKFSLVALWFMHLRFDSRLFRRLFVTGIYLATTVYLIVLVTFEAISPLIFVVILAVMAAIPVVLYLLPRSRARTSR